MTEPEGARPADLPLRPRRRWLRWTALGASVVVLGAAGAVWALYSRLDGNIRTDVETVNQLRRFESERPEPVVREAENILLIGSDDRGGDNGKYGRDNGTQRSDTTILLHLSADRSSATGVSIPRDLMVEIPECERPDGTTTGARFAQFNWAFQFGGAGCTIRTVEKLTGIRVDHHVVVDFAGFTKLVDAVGGVEVCLAEPVDDPDAQLSLDAGPQTLDGEQALGYVRTRKGIGDGSDTQRMARQQEFLSLLVRKVHDEGILTDPGRLYSVLDAVTSSLTADPGLDSLAELYDLADSVRGIPADRVRFMTAPRQPYTYDPNRDELVQPDADRLFTALRNDEPVPEPSSEATASQGPDAETTGPGTTAPGSPSPTESGTGVSRAGFATPDAGTGTPGPTASPSSGARASAAGSLCGRAG
ncbi:LCP family protein [Streptomyces glaucosporus]|uniref:LCP family protein n=1 Tax=Streptomyces glaucosporus TaxID=284044 RepID=A0ABP5W1G6_9ACTN